MGKRQQASFDEHYGVVYGERWADLKAALLAGAPKISRVNRFAEAGESLLRETPERFADWCPECFGSGLNAPASGSPEGESLEVVYEMDLGSVLVAKALQVGEGMEVLDLCAAPGGKSLILAEELANSGVLVANELSRARRFKLRAILDRYLPPELLQRVKVTGYDGTTFGVKHQECFDRVLVDAPCSAEGHLIRRSDELSRWSPSRTSQLARRQYALLCSALLAVREGGRLVYATCSISPKENDGVIQRLLKRKAGQVTVHPFASPLGEATDWGWQILPDKHGAGPAYFAVLERLGKDSESGVPVAN